MSQGEVEDEKAYPGDENDANVYSSLQNYTVLPKFHYI